MNMGTPALKIRGLRKSFGSIEIIRGVDLDIHSGERHALIGPNGAGKSTLFHLISGRIKPTAGTVALHGNSIEGMSPVEISRAGLSRSFQITNIFMKMTVLENLQCAVFWRLGYRYTMTKFVTKLKNVDDECTALMEELGLSHRRDSMADMLTYPEQRALELGLAIAGGANTLLLDEPMAGMSHSETASALDLIRRVSKGKSLLMVEHDMGVIFNLADRISVLVYGEIIATGTPEEIRNNEKVKEAYLGASLDDETKGNSHD